MEICPKYGRLSNCDGNDKVGELRCFFHSRSSVRFRPMISRALKLGMKLEWLEDGVKTVMGPIPGVKFDETRQRKTWFNSMVAAYTGWEDARNDPKKAVTFGDGSPLPAEIVYDCLTILEEESVAVPWKKGDVLLIDNLAVLHSRRPFDPPRRVLASLCR